MEYRKPAIAVVGKAVEAIQSQKGSGASDSQNQLLPPSIAAYEADE